uniref:Guanylate cyclase n=1 Tax=Caenorhabditis japonica TaxID=281687 RepID=A0A8R1E3H3_CAEJA
MRLSVTEERHKLADSEREKFLTLKGQMVYMEEWESICFVGIPVMSHLPQMYRSGLFINDFALHDSMTILFTDIVEFTKTCSSLTPLEVIELLQVVYTNFDKVIDEHGVYKVETIGDAYMVVSGAPTKTEHDAEFILDCASQFLAEAGKLVNLNEKVPKIDVRAGVHSGAVVAGVVGLTMPRYCLFGETVNVANMMEQNSVPMKILVSESTHNKIEETDPGLYQFERQEEIELKEDQKIQTFFVVGRHGAPRVPSLRDCESRLDDSQAEEDEDDDLLFPPKPGRQSPTSEAEEELKKRAQLSFTPVSDTGIENYSRASNRTPRRNNDSVAGK